MMISFRTSTEIFCGETILMMKRIKNMNIPLLCSVLHTLKFQPYYIVSNKYYVVPTHSVEKWKIRQINSIVFSLVKRYFHEIFVKEVSQ